MAQTLNDIKSLLGDHGLHPKHRLGQNFLHDGNQMRRIIAAADIRDGDHVLEVGPGTGALTERLLEAGANVVAVEIDGDLKPILEERLLPFGDRVTLVFEDILTGKHQVNGHAIAPLAGEDFKLIANLPYNVASPLLANLALDHPAMRQAVVMIQKEVADRLLASPGGKTYGPLGILIQVLCQVELVGTLSPACFWPKPKVGSAVVRLLRRETPLAEDPHAFAAFVQRLFNQRRKQIKAILSEGAAAEAGVDPKARPEQLSLEELVRLAGDSLL